MKIIHFIYALNPGGAQRLVIDLCNELNKFGHEVILCTLRDDLLSEGGFYKSELNKKIQFINLNLPAGLRLSNIIALYKVIKQTKPNIIHCHQNLVNYIFPLYIIFKNSYFFHTIHTDPPNEISNKLEYYIKRFFYKRKRFTPITISNETSDSFKRFYKIKKYTEIINGRKMPVPSSEYDSVSIFFEQLRQKAHTIFIHVGRYDPIKNQEMLVETFNQILKSDTHIFLLIIGPDFDSEEGNKLKKLAHENIIFLGSKYNIADYYLNADAFCLSSINEGMPITLIEAMACGCVPICTPVGGIKDTIENGITGFLANSYSKDDFFDTVNLYLNQKDKIKKDILNESYKKRFSIQECTKQHVELYYNLLARKKDKN